MSTEIVFALLALACVAPMVICPLKHMLGWLIISMIFVGAMIGSAVTQ